MNIKYHEAKLNKHHDRDCDALYRLRTEHNNLVSNNVTAFGVVLFIIGLKKYFKSNNPRAVNLVNSSQVAYCKSDLAGRA